MTDNAHDTPLVLGFDTSGTHCAAALVSGDTVLASRSEEMGRGQAERLMPLIEELLAETGHTWRDLSAIGVGTGPGNFTGIRISVSAARGLALGLDIPAYGIDGFEARAQALQAPGLITIPAPRDQLYVALPDDALAIMDRDAAQQVADSHGLTIAPQPAPDHLACAIAQLAAAHWPDTAPPPAPMYLRPADAAPSRDEPPVLLD
ncbi:tRNA (adenosine(37)-N6)-threonylcarbamoyltransferase complex dimerization subunit type 1 TsaB [Arenibacterium sp. CAU 1754]